MSTQVLQITELTPKAGAIHQVSRAWVALPVPKGIVQRRVYEALDGSTVLELAALEKMDDLAALQPSWSAAWDMLGPDMASDFRRQIVTFVEAPKDTTDSLPATPYVQLRHVEVQQHGQLRSGGVCQGHFARPRAPGHPRERGQSRGDHHSSVGRYLPQSGIALWCLGYGDQSIGSGKDSPGAPG